MACPVQALGLQEWTDLPGPQPSRSQLLRGETHKEQTTVGKWRQKELASCYGSLELKILGARGGKGISRRPSSEGAPPCVLSLPPGAAGNLEKPTRLGSDGRAAPGHQQPLTGYDSFWPLKTGTQHPGTWEEGGIWESLTRVFLKSP